MSDPPQIVAMGGGGFSMEPENLALDRFVLSLCRSARPRICFLPTASGDAADYIERFYLSFRTLPCTPSHLSLFKLSAADLRAFVLDQDVIYVGGGNTRNLLVLWRESGLDTILHEAWQSGIVLAGLSAGALCWFENGVSDSVRAHDLQAIDCLGFIAGSFCPHYDGEVERRPSYHRLLSANLLKPGYAADDGAALHFRERSLIQAVSSRRQANAYSVRLIGEEVEETVLNIKFLDS